MEDDEYDDDDDEEEDNNDFFSSSFTFQFHQTAMEEEDSNDDNNNNNGGGASEHTLEAAIQRIENVDRLTKQDEDNDNCSSTQQRQLEQDILNELNHRTTLIQTYMGTMALCRGRNGDVLREAGAIRAVLNLLYMIIQLDLLLSFQLFCSSSEEEKEEGSSSKNPLPVCQTTTTTSMSVHRATVNVVSNSLGSLRDLACGSAPNRLAIGSFQCSSSPYFQKSTSNSVDEDNIELRDGIDILHWFMKRYKSHRLFSQIIQCKYRCYNKHDNDDDEEEDTSANDDGKKELRLLTNVYGVIRNITHSTRSNCQMLHDRGVTHHLIERLLSTTSTHDHQVPPKEQITSSSSNSKDRSSENSSPTTEDRPLKSLLPDADSPWRETCYRIAGSLINMAEKCEDCATECAQYQHHHDDFYYLQSTLNASSSPKERQSNHAYDHNHTPSLNHHHDHESTLIWLLLEFWGGMGIYQQYAITKKDDKSIVVEENGGVDKKRNNQRGQSIIQVLHLGLASILRAVVQLSQVTTFSNLKAEANNNANNSHLLDTIECILEKEEERKQIARNREDLQKQRSGK